ncbi:hypothetical protein [Streptomyces sp. SPB162]|uniref:hypothetical protein n=1 Tax=Streptomyces sp. SPB162 TaxID=2940560 RepID=UPI0024077230|nr:hypothetical protein [Streptomyces sp. SPB162]MDF9814610.1 hypothetical protein [Streptomyces sp. SPB162]
MGRPGDEPEHPQDEVSLALGRLLVELGEKIQSAGVDGVQILAVAEIEARDLSWFRAGWDEHARSIDGDPGERPEAAKPPDPELKLLRFPESSPHPLPIVGADGAPARQLMPHRPRPRPRRRDE